MGAFRFNLPAPVTGRLRAVDELKGVAIILIVLYHAGGVMVWNNLLHLDVGVDLFVILSGIGLGFGAHYTGAASFLARRFTRILPAYWLILTLCWVCNTHFLGEHYSSTNLWIHYLGIQGAVGGQYIFAINDSFWFITLIVGLYVLYCPSHALQDSPEQLLLLGAASSALVAFLLRFSPGYEGLIGFIATRMPGFFIGLLLGRLLKTGRIEFRIGPVLAVAVLLLVYLPGLFGVVYYSPLVALSLMAAYLFGVKRLVPMAIEKPAARTLKFLGDHSLEIFLIHQPLIRDYNFYLYWRWFANASPSAGLRAVGIACALSVTVALSMALHWLLQKIYLPLPTRLPLRPA